MRHGSLVATRGVAEKAGTQISKKTPKRSLFLVRRLGLVVEKRDVLPPERDELVVSAAGAPHVEAIVVIKQGGKTVLQDIWQQVLEMLDVGQYQRRDPDRELFSENRPIKFAIQVSRHAGAHQRIFKADHHGENNAPFPLGQPLIDSPWSSRSMPRRCWAMPLRPSSSPVTNFFWMSGSS